MKTIFRVTNRSYFTMTSILLQLIFHLYRPGDRGGYRQSRRNFARQSGFGQFWGADSEYRCYTKGCGGV